MTLSSFVGDVLNRRRRECRGSVQRRPKRAGGPAATSVMRLGDRQPVLLAPISLFAGGISTGH